VKCSGGRYRSQSVRTGTGGGDTLSFETKRRCLLSYRNGGCKGSKSYSLVARGERKFFTNPTSLQNVTMVDNKYTRGAKRI